jgi:alpha-1,2-mannosyltransferase
MNPLAAGLTCGLLLFKPQLAVILAVVLVASQGRRALAGLTITVATLFLITVTALPGSLSNYLHQLPVNLQAIQELPNYTWHRHITFLAWWRILLQGHTGALPGEPARWLALTCMTAIGAAFIMMLWQARKDARRADRMISAAIATSPLLMPYYMDYDLTLLAVAAVLCACDALRNGIDRTVCLAWTAFYLVVELNPPIAGSTRVIPAVPALAVLSIVLIRKARQPIASAAFQPFHVDSLPLAA